MTELKEEIHDYWSGRAKGYSDYNQQEMADDRRAMWKNKLRLLLKNYFSSKEPSEIKILDVGTGPGFFAILLTELGYQVTAVDQTEEMLKEARTNAGELAKKIHWMVGDAEKLSFEEKSFDAVVTRNVTWNLPHPDQAYKEWYRVLKPGGVLYNFDADWYGYLYDDEKRSGYENDRAQTKEQQVTDYYDGTDVDRMEAIARAVPLSQAARPQWDLNAMKEAGFASAEADTEVWRQVWNEEEILNNSASPLFLLTGTKRREVFHLNNASVEPGQRWEGMLSLADGNISLPAAIFHGERPGKTILITAGVHAEEYVGIQAAIELSQKLKPWKVSGTILIIKVMNVPAFEARSGSVGLTDGKDLYRVFPGDPNGSEMERLAWAVSQELISTADYYIDIHSGDDFEKLTSYVYYGGAAEENVVKRSRSMAQQVDVPYMVRSRVSAGGSYNYAAAQGIPSILIERGGMGDWNYEQVRSSRRDVRNILCHLGLYAGEKDYRSYYPLEAVDLIYQDAEASGLWYPFKNPGDTFSAGEILGEVRDYQGRVKEVVSADYDGVILYQTGSLQVVANGPMITYGRIISPFDERKERVVNYWTKRSESFLSQRRDELHDEIALRWLREIKAHIPSGRKLKILDVGCGAGFFTILLAKEGHEVTGIDLTPDMIENAKKLADEEGVECTFEVMDAENPDFPADTFDVIVSRNLTWTLPHADYAYREWVRVLKPDGMLINFDANYGIADATADADLPEEHAHNTIGLEMMEENEAIKRQLPISSYSRPAWDLETLQGLQAKEFFVDMALSSRIFLKKDEFYNPVPIFMIAAKK